jgi:hypothetical protein
MSTKDTSTTATPSTPTFCNDADLLLWEPHLLRTAWSAATCVQRGRARIAGRQVSPLVSSITADESHDIAPRPGDLVHLRSRSINVTRVLHRASTSGTLSLDQPIRPATRDGQFAEQTGIEFRIMRFDHARQFAAQTVMNLCGIDPGERIEDVARLRRPTVLATLEIIHGLLASAGGEQASDLIVRQQLYARLFRRALRMLRVEIIDRSAASSSRLASPDLLSLRCA